MPSLLLFAADGRTVEREVPIGGDEISIGLDPDNTLIVLDPGVSRRHARVLATSRGYLLVDAESQDGVWIGERRVRHHFLAAGDVFRIGDHLIQFRDPDSPTAVDGLGPATVPALPPAGPFPTPVPQEPTVLEVGSALVELQPTFVDLAPPVSSDEPTAPQPTSIPPQSAPSGLWVASILLLVAGAGAAGLALYASRSAWTPWLSRTLAHEGASQAAGGVTPELAGFGRLARVSARQTITLGSRGSQHPLGTSARLVVPDAALADQLSLEVAVVALDLRSVAGGVRDAHAYLLDAASGTPLAQPIVLEIAWPGAQTSVAEHEAGGWRTLPLAPGAAVRVPIDRLSRRTLAVVEWNGPPPVMPVEDSYLLPDESERPAPAPSRLLEDPSYRRFIGAEPGQRRVDHGELCTELAARVLRHPGLSLGRPRLGAKEVPAPAPGLPTGSPFEELVSSPDDPRTRDRNVYVRLTNDPPGDGDPRSREQRLEDAIIASPGALSPAVVMEMALQASAGNYPLATLTAHNLLKSISCQGWQEAAMVGRLMARGRSDVSFPKRYGEVASRLSDLRAAPGDKMGIWRHAFVPLAITAWTGDPGEADGALSREYAVRWLGRLTNPGAPMDDEKRASGQCFARAAREIRNAQDHP